MSNSKTFDDRFNAWKNGANYWKDIRGIDLYGNTQSQPESQPDMTHEEMQVLNRQANSIINEYTNKYDNGKDNQQPDIPSRRLRKYISSQEGSDFVGQNRKFHGDAVGAKYNEVRNTVGNDIWNKLPQNSKEALTSYYYNIKPSSFAPTANALRKWHQTGDDNEMYKVRDSINVGLNQKGMRGLRSRRIDERGWLMEGFKPKSKTLKQVEGLQNDIQNQIMPRQPQQISAMPLDTPYKQPMTSQSILPPIVDMLGAIQNDQQLPLQLFNR